MKDFPPPRNGRAVATLGPPPLAERFPAYPSTWYLFCRSRDLRPGPLSKDLLGRRLVAFRAAGKAVVLDARCSHLGADLGRGCVVGAAIQCPYHHWEYAGDGRCTRIPAQDRIPAFARQAVFPVVERHGLVFFFNGPEPLFPLPFFFDCDPADFVPGPAMRFAAECSWVLLAGNGFDTEHFRAVHDRTLIAPPTVDGPAPFARRMRYTAQVTGRSIYDRLIRCFVGRVVEVSITSWGGPFILVTGTFPRAGSYILIAVQPQGERCLMEVVVFAPRGRSRLARALLQSIGLRVRRWFTRGFLADDIDRLPGIRYNPHSLIESDRELIEFFHWAAALPAGPPEPSRAEVTSPLAPAGERG